MGPLSNLHRKARELLGLGGPAAAPAAAGGDDAAGLAVAHVLQPLPHAGAAAQPNAAIPTAAPPTNAGPTAANPADDGVRLRPAHRDEVRAAVRLILSQPNRPADDAQVNDFLQFAAPGRLDLARLRVAELRGRLLWAVLPVLSPGRTALLLAPPPPARPVDRAVAERLLGRVGAELRASGTRLAQALLDPADAAAAALFNDAGFGRMAELIYLAAEPRRRAAVPALPPGFEWVGYEPAAHALFARAIAATYEQSLDCPALNGVRDMDDVIAGHRASGEFDPALWRVLVEPAAEPVTAPDGVARGDGPAPPVPLGVLLLAPIPAAGALELVYLGLAPAARGRRLGDLLLRTALAAVADAGLHRLTLAVDAQNAPALKLYYRHGLARVGSKLAMMRDLAERWAGEG